MYVPYQKILFKGQIFTTVEYSHTAAAGGYSAAASPQALSLHGISRWIFLCAHTSCPADILYIAAHLTFAVYIPGPVHQLVLLAFWQACEIIQHIRMFSQFHCKANGKLLIIYHFHHLSISFSHLNISYTLSCEICAPIKVRIFNIL